MTATEIIRQEKRITVYSASALIPGDVVKESQYNGVNIQKVVRRVAYARSGNFNNPTIYYYYVAAGKDGRLLSIADKLSELKSDIRRMTA